MSGELVATIGYEIIKIAEREGLLDRLKDAFRKKHRILLLGSTGSGKSQFLKSFGNIFAEALDHVARTEFSHTKRVDLDGRLFEFVDTPGQELHKSRRADAIRDCLNKGLSGVVNVVCYGYHEYGVDVEQVIENGTVKQNYLEIHRGKEIKLLNEWVHLLKNEWVITTISKADIWWDNKDEVINFYTEGTYANALAQANGKIDILTTPYSSVGTKFYDKIPCSGNFDDKQRRLNRNMLFSKLLEAVSRV